MTDDIEAAIVLGRAEIRVGYWKQGETKRSSRSAMRGWIDSRTKSITITQVDFTNGGTSRGLVVEWSTRKLSEEKSSTSKRMLVLPSKAWCDRESADVRWIGRN
jgi:hypothetical protein